MEPLFMHHHIIFPFEHFTTEIAWKFYGVVVNGHVSLQKFVGAAYCTALLTLKVR